MGRHRRGDGRLVPPRQELDGRNGVQKQARVGNPRIVDSSSIPGANASGVAASRHRNVAICPRAKLWPGENVVADVPVVMPPCNIQGTVSVQHCLSGMSVNCSLVGAFGYPARCQRNMANMLRVNF